MKYINLSSLLRNSSETTDILSLSAKKGLSLDLTTISSSGSLDNVSTTDESSFKFTQATAITGFSGGIDGKLLYIYNGNESSSLTIKHNLTSSSGNKILTNNGQDIILPTNGGIILQYDSGSTVWRTIGIGESPTFTELTVTGSTSLNGLTYPSADGTVGQAIITVASGGGGSLTYKIMTAPHVSLKVGMPVYWNGSSYFPANASTNTKIPTAIVKELNVGDYTVQFGGILTLSNTQWNELTGESGGLSISSGSNIYYLSDVTDGGITNVSPIFSIPILNCIKNDATDSTVEIKFGTLSSTLLNESYSREREVFTANGSGATFTLTLTPYSRNTTLVTIDGVVQQSNAFSISNKDIIFSENPPANSEIEINYVTQKNLNYANIVKHVEVTSTSKTAFTLPVTPSSESEVMAWVGGSYQDNSNFTLSGNVLTFDTTVDSGVKVQFVIFTSIQFTDFPFIKRKSITISNSGTKTLIDVFGSQATGRYDFHVIANPLIGGTIRLQETNPINVSVETFSTDISSTASTNNKLNIYINGSGNLEFQNLLGSSISIMLERHQ